MRSPGLFTSRPALRWLAPVAVLALVLTAGTAGTMLRADAAGALPSRTAAQLLVDLQKADPVPFSGTVSQQSDLGLPKLPALDGGSGSSDLSSLVSGSHTLRVWYDGPQRVRLALLGTLGESDVVRNGSDLWLWSSQDRSATHRTLPAKAKHAAPDASKLPADLPKTPQEAADQALKALDPTTKVTTDGSAKVAGRSAYLLILTPRDTSSLVGQVRLAIDGARHIPLQVQVFAKGASEPAFQVGFTSISFTRPVPTSSGSPRRRDEGDRGIREGPRQGIRRRPRRPRRPAPPALRGPLGAGRDQGCEAGGGAAGGRQGLDQRGRGHDAVRAGGRAWQGQAG